MGNIKEHCVGSKERRNLELVSSMLNFIQQQRNNKRFFDCHVGTTYFDFGQDWKWTTIIAGYSRDSWQILYAKQMDDICNATTLEELVSIANALYESQKDLFER